MSKTIVLHSEEKPIYEIRMEQDFSTLAENLAPLELSKRRLCLVMDSNVATFHQAELESVLAPLGASLTTFVFEAGEEQKNLDTVGRLYTHLIEKNFDRKDVLIAAGGGVTGDLTGYAAATYLRGIRFVQIPTTLLAMADSSIGGKTGVDFRSYKNMVGAFHQPSAVYMNFSLLATLPEREYLSGMGEIIKHAYIKDTRLLLALNAHRTELRQKAFSVLEEILYQSCSVKQAVVERDPKEQGERALLNFGHTIGHAIEKLTEFQLLHGECVALGMLAAAHISRRRGKAVSGQTFLQMKELLEAYGLPTAVEGLSDQDILQATKLDKKMDAGQIRFVLLEAVGQAVIDYTITEEELLEGIRELVRR